MEVCKIVCFVTRWVQTTAPLLIGGGQSPPDCNLGFALSRSASDDGVEFKGTRHAAAVMQMCAELTIVVIETLWVL